MSQTEIDCLKQQFLQFNYLDLIHTQSTNKIFSNSLVCGVQEIAPARSASIININYLAGYIIN